VKHLTSRSNMAYSRKKAVKLGLIIILRTPRAAAQITFQWDLV